MAASYEIPEHQRANTPEDLERRLGWARASGVLPSYPFGSDLDLQEQRLIATLEALKAMTATPRLRARAIGRALVQAPPSEADANALARLGLDRPSGLADLIMRRLVALALKATPQPV